MKGTVFWGLLQSMQKLGMAAPAGADVSTELRQALETRDLFATSWYPVEWYRELLGYIVRRGGPSALRDTVQLSTRESVSTVHRFLMKAFSPDMLLKQGARVFSSFFDAKISSTPLGAGHTLVEWTACGGFDATCWTAQVLTVEELVAMTGVRVQRKVVRSGGGTGDDALSLELFWGR